jgi:hypothetical protein
MRATSGKNPPNMSPVMKSQSKNSFSRLINKIVSARGQQVKLGIDLHALDGVVCAQVDGSVPQRPMRLSHALVATLVEKLLEAGLEVYCCYEAGPCGFGLCRKLTGLGATAYVVAPVSLADGRRQKTDGLDARALGGAPATGRSFSRACLGGWPNRSSRCVRSSSNSTPMRRPCAKS